jgi:hypothetical protein
MDRRLWIAPGLTPVTLSVAIVVDLAVATFGGFDSILYTLWMIVPASAIAVAAIATSGFLFGCRLSGAQATPADLPFLMAAGLALPLLILLLQYGLVASPGPWGTTMSFGQFLAASVTDVRMSAHSRLFGDAPPRALGEFGWFVLVPRLAALLAVAKIVHVSCGGGRRQYDAFGAPNR